MDKAGKKSSEERARQLEKAASMLMAAVEEAEQLAARATEEITAIQEEYEDAMEKLRWAVEPKNG